MRTQFAYLATDQKVRPIGIRVVEPPTDTLQSARGRLYAVIEFAESTPEMAQQVERALSAIQRTYYTIKGTQSYVLGEALHEALQALSNPDQPTDADSDLGILLVALLENRLIAIGAGAVIALFTNGGKVDVFPPGAIRYTESGAPAFDIYRQDAPVGTAFLLAGNYCLEYFSLKELASTVAMLTHQNLSDIIDALCQHATIDQLPGLFVVTSTSEGRTEGNGAVKGATNNTAKGATTTQSPPPRRRLGGLPAALQGPPARQRPDIGGDMGGAKPENRAAGGQQRRLVDDPQSTDLDDDVRGRSITNPVEKHPAAGWSGAFQLGLQQTKAMLAKILPERLPAGAHSVQSEPAVGSATYAYSTNPVLPRQAPLLHPAAEGGNMPGRSANPGSGATMLDRLATFKPPARATGSRARLYILLALLILILTPVVVTAVYWSRDRRNQAEAEQAMAMAEASFLAAETALENGDKATARVKLTEAQTFILAADNLVGGRSTRADELGIRIEREMADLLQVQPLYALAAPLIQFVPDAMPKRVLVNDQDIYVLDVGRQVVQYFQLDPTRNMVTNLEGEVVLQRGATIENVTIGDLVDITWQPPISGVQDKSYLLVLDRNNNLFRYDRRVEGVSRLALGGQEQLRTPIRMKVYAERLYIADEGVNQLFRYTGDYTQPPTLWFDAQAQSDLSSLRSMDIDGDIWMLYAQGQVSRYRTGAQVPFSLENSVGAIGAPVDIAVGDQGNSMVYVADRDQERILVYSKDGLYQRQLRAPEGHPLRDLQAIFVDEVDNTIYILTQTSLFKHPLSQGN